MSYVIEKNIPLPGRHTQSITGVLRQMELGDSILFTDKTNSQISCFFNQFRPAGKKFSARTVKGGPGVRVWRIA